MSLTAIAWLLCFFVLLLASYRKPVYACSAYLMTFYTAPQYWWWGKALTSLTMRWNLYAALALLVVVAFKWQTLAKLSRTDKRFFVLLGIYVLNAYVVHSLFAVEPRVSARYFDVLWKSAGLAFLLRLCIRDMDDLQIFLLTIVALCGYVGYEVVVNERGQMVHGRLEGIGIPGATGANGIAALMSMGIILAGYLILSGPNAYSKVIAFCAAPFILDTVLRCSSRGAFLGLIASGVWLVIAAKGQVKKYAMWLLVFGSLAVFLQAGDDKIWDRFYSTFVPAEELDASASHRLDFWKAAINMLGDYPLGSGGKAAFNSDRGFRYIAHFEDKWRSVHNGYFDCATSWGLQGFTMFMLTLGTAFAAMFFASRAQEKHGNLKTAFLGAGLQAALFGQLICTMFTNILDGEWYLWMAACSLAYAQFPLGPIETDSEKNIRENTDQQEEEEEEEELVEAEA